MHSTVNITAAGNLSILNRENVTRVVNCQDLEAENFHQGKPGMQYFRFPISHWWREKGMDQPVNVLRYFRPYFTQILSNYKTKSLYHFENSVIVALKSDIFTFYTCEINKVDIWLQFQTLKKFRQMAQCNIIPQ